MSRTNRSAPKTCPALCEKKVKRLESESRKCELENSEEPVYVPASNVLAAPEEQDKATTGTKETQTTSHAENQTPSSCRELTGTSPKLQG